MIRPERMTIKAQEAFRDAGEDARGRGNPVVNDAHLFLALTDHVRRNGPPVPDAPPPSAR